jgi:hypothetical protein
METMHAAGRRNLPPVPRPSAEPSPSDEIPAERTMEGRRREAPERVDNAPPEEIVLDELVVDELTLALADEPEHALDDGDPAQRFVSRLRAAATEFAAAAGAESAVVREAVPPARHRRSRCRVVLRYRGGDEADLTFLGSIGRPGTPAWQDFDLQIQRWLGTGQHREAAWLVEDPEAPDGVAVDVPAWLATG